MAFLDIFIPKESSKTSEIGRVECSRDNVCDMLVGMMNSMGMVNPGVLISHSKKGVKIQKKGNKYNLILTNYVPPIAVSWTGSISYSRLLSLIDKAAEENKKIACANIYTSNSGERLLQLAIG